MPEAQLAPKKPESVCLQDRRSTLRHCLEGATDERRGEWDLVAVLVKRPSGSQRDFSRPGDDLVGRFGADEHLFGRASSPGDIGDAAQNEASTGDAISF